MPSMTLKLFIEENREGLVTEFPHHLGKEQRDIALAYILKKPFIIENWFSKAGYSGALERLQAQVEWQMVPNLRFVWPSGQSYTLNFSKLPPSDKTKIRRYMKKERGGLMPREQQMKVLADILYMLGYEVGSLQCVFDRMVMANMLFAGNVR